MSKVFKTKMKVCFEEYQKAPIIQTFAVNEKETKLAMVANIDNHFDLWLLNLKSRRLKKIPIGEDGYTVFFDKEDRLYVTFDKKGDECKKIHYVDEEKEEIAPLFTSSEAKTHVVLLYDKYKHQLFYSSIDQLSKVYSVYRYEMDTGQEYQFYGEKNQHYFIGDFDSLNNKALLLKQISRSHRTGYIYSCSEKTCYPMIEDQEKNPYVISDAQFLTDSIAILCMNYGKDRNCLFRYDMTNGQVKELLSFGNKDILSAYYDIQINSFYLKVSDAVQDYIYMYNLIMGEYHDINCPVTNIHKIHFINGTLYVLGDASTVTSNIFKYKEGFWKNVTSYKLNVFLVAPDIINLKSDDDVEFESLHFKKNNNKIILWLHGGPQASERNAYNGFHQFFLQNGYDVFAPNFRGSKGYGKQFTEMVRQQWASPMVDVWTSIRYLRKQYEQIYVIGGSYGGYLAMLTHTRLADYITATVNLFGPSDLLTFIESVPEHWRNNITNWVGDPEKDKIRLMSESPIYYLEGINKPLLLIHGENDPRVKKEQMDCLAKELKRLKIPHQYIIVENEGHGFSSKVHESETCHSILRFLNNNE